MRRRDILTGAMAMAASAPAAGVTESPGSGDLRAMTVRGWVASDELGLTLPHEHALARFQPWAEAETMPIPYDHREVIDVVLPHLQRLKRLGCQTFVDATAVGLGRDPLLLKRLSELSGLNILTVTGAYAAFDETFLAAYVRTDTPQELAQRWTAEWHHGIGDTGVRPGFIKLGFGGGQLTGHERTLIGAAALAHLTTGLTIGAHTGPAVSAYEQLDALQSAGVHPSAWIWIHAQNETDNAQLLKAAAMGAWIELDGYRPETTEAVVTRVLEFKHAGLIDRLLLSQDAGWYNVGEPGGGVFHDYSSILTDLVPALSHEGFTEREITQVFVVNPANAFSVRVRKYP